MTADMTGGDSLASQCLAFCQTLASQGMDFHFSLTINSNFSFSLDTRKTKGNSAVAKKRSSPSTQRRNARRREAFLKRKLNPVPLSPSASDAPAEDQVKVGEVRKTFKCEQCGNDFKSENGLKIHTGKAHKVNSTPPPPDRLRQQPGSASDIPTSPLLDASREEVREEKEVTLSPLRAGYDPRLRSSPIYPPKVPCLECFARDPCPLQCGYTSNWNGYTPG